jgi:hypothetical protein
LALTLALVGVVAITAVAARAPAQCTDPPPDLVAWWAGDGDAIDRSGGLELVLLGGASFATGHVTSRTGEAFSFDGVDDSLFIGATTDLSMTTAYSIEAWVLSTGPTPDYRIIAIRGGGNANDVEVYIQRNTNDLIVAHNRTNGGSFDFVGFVDPPAGVFFHLAVTFDGVEVRGFYNGLEAGVTQGTRVVTAPLYTNIGWEFGRTQHTAFIGLGRYTGLIDELSIYDRALTAAEIQAIYDAGSAGKCKDFDDDGLTDDDEDLFGTDLFDPDTDGDGLLDGTEVLVADGGGCPDPLNPDSDGDTLADGAEVDAGTNPCSADTDGDTIPDNIDPLPTNPEGTEGVIEAHLRTLCDFVGGLPLENFTAPNNNAAKGRRNAICNKLNAAANAVAAGDYQSAHDQLNSLLEKLDDQPPPPDWMEPGPEKDTVRGDIEEMALLISFFL